MIDNNKQFINVNRDRFFELLHNDKYEQYHEEIITINGKYLERTSYPEYKIIDKETKEFVGMYSDGSWENYYIIIIDLVDKQDIVNHYDKIVSKRDLQLKEKYEEITNLHNKLKSAFKTNSERYLDDSDLLLVKVKEGSLIIPPEKKLIRKGPSIMDFLKDD